MYKVVHTTKAQSVRHWYWCRWFHTKRNEAISEKCRIRGCFLERVRFALCLYSMFLPPNNKNKVRRKEMLSETRHKSRLTRNQIALKRLLLLLLLLLLIQVLPMSVVAGGSHETETLAWGTQAEKVVGNTIPRLPRKWRWISFSWSSQPTVIFMGYQLF